MIFRTVLVFLVLSFGSAFAAGGGGGGDDSSSDALYKSSVSLIKRAGKLEKKDNKAKAEKLYTQAFKKSLFLVSFKGLRSIEPIQ